MILRICAVFITFSCLTIPLHAGTNRKIKGRVSFHIQTDEHDNPKMIFQFPVGSKTYHFKKSPEFSTQDILSYEPRSTSTGDDSGLILTLKESSAKRLSFLSNIHQQKWLLSSVNGRIVDAVLIDKQIDDGMLVIWKGVSMDDIDLLDETLTRTGEVGKKKKK